MMLRLTEEEVQEELLRLDKWVVKDEKWIEKKIYVFRLLKRSRICL